jgi:hypothetical protein
MNQRDGLFRNAEPGGIGFCGQESENRRQKGVVCQLTPWNEGEAEGMEGRIKRLEYSLDAWE